MPQSRLSESLSFIGNVQLSADDFLLSQLKKINIIRDIILNSIIKYCTLCIGDYRINKMDEIHPQQQNYSMV